MIIPQWICIFHVIFESMNGWKFNTIRNNPMKSPSWTTLPMIINTFPIIFSKGTNHIWIAIITIVGNINEHLLGVRYYHHHHHHHHHHFYLLFSSLKVTECDIQSLDYLDNWPKVVEVINCRIWPSLSVSKIHTISPLSTPKEGSSF